MKKILSIVLVLTLVMMTVTPLAFADNNGNGKGNSNGNNKSYTDSDDEDDNGYKYLPYGLAKKEVLPYGLFKKTVLPKGLEKRLPNDEEMSSFYMKRLENIVKSINEKMTSDSYLLSEDLLLEVNTYLASVETLATLDEVMTAIIDGRELVKKIVATKLATAQEIEAYNLILTEVLLEFVLVTTEEPDLLTNEEYELLSTWLENNGLIDEEVSVAYIVIEDNIKTLEELVSNVDPSLTLTDGLFMSLEEADDEDSDDEDSDDDEADDEEDDGSDDDTDDESDD